jgi:hypothetical protein
VEQWRKAESSKGFGLRQGDRYGQCVSRQVSGEWGMALAAGDWGAVKENLARRPVVREETSRLSGHVPRMVVFGMNLKGITHLSRPQVDESGERGRLWYLDCGVSQEFAYVLMRAAMRYVRRNTPMHMADKLAFSWWLRPQVRPLSREGENRVRRKRLPPRMHTACTSDAPHADGTCTCIRHSLKTAIANAYRSRDR